MKNYIVYIAFFILGISITYAQPLQSFNLTDVSLLESPFYKAQQTDMAYLTEMDPDRLLAPFLIDAGIETAANPYPNWENTGLNGHIGGHYLSAIAMMYASTGNKNLKKRLNYMIDQLEACQLKNGNGYVGGIPGGQEIWKDIAGGNINAANFSLNDKWVPLYNIHKLFAGLRDAYLFAGNEKAGDLLINLTEWFMEVVSGLTEQQIQDMLRSEHGGLNEVFADVAAISKEDQYLELAKKFSHQVILNPLVKKEDQLTGLHANTQIPKVIGYQRIAQLNKHKEWTEAADFFWETIVNKRSVSIGGNSVREHFHPEDDFSKMIQSNQGPETCNTYNMLRLSKLLFLSNPEAKYMDYYERGLYNHILSSQHPEGGFVYFTPMRPRHYRVYSQAHQGFWCCVGSGMENHAKYGEMIYAHDEKDLFINLFIPSRLKWEKKGLILEQNTQFPFEENTSFSLSLKRAQKFGLHIRYPEWVETGKLVVKINGKKQKVLHTPSSYITLERTWSDGDKVELSLPMHTELEFLPDGASWASFVHGPIVLAAATGVQDLKGLKANDSRMGHVADGTFLPIEKAPLIISKGKNIDRKIDEIPGKPLTFSASKLVYPNESKDLQLVPFFSIHDSRYMIYWQITNSKNLENIKQDLREKEREILALEARTVDEVACGEQQPESEHNFKGEDTDIGSSRGRSWRQTSGWFSYDFQNNGKGKTLRMVYEKQGWSRKFDILLNNQILKTLILEDSWDEGPITVEYEIPEQILENMREGNFELKIEAPEGASTGRIYYFRLLTD